MFKASGSHQKKRKVFTPWKPGKNDCLYCRRDLGTEVRIRCVVCEEPVEGVPASFCVECFGARVEIGGHKSDHAYQVVDSPSVCLLSEDWTADEELRLLEALEKVGYGNWEAAAEHVGNKRTRQACERHYVRFYQESTTFPLPDLSNPLAARADESALEVVEPPPPAPAAAAAAADGGDAVGADGTAPPPEATDGAEPSGGAEADGAEAAVAAPPAAPVPVNERAKPATGGKTKRTTAQTMPAGFMPLRGDFDTEWTDDAELQLGCACLPRAPRAPPAPPPAPPPPPAPRLPLRAHPR